MTTQGTKTYVPAAAVNRQRLRFKWSHQWWLHRAAVRVYNAIMRNVPFRLKYGVGMMLRKGTYPYRLIRPGGTVVQIGAPKDTMLAGRSRAMYFGFFCGPTGKVVVIEPDTASEQQFQKWSGKYGLKNMIFRRLGAWHEQGTLKLFVNNAHPATNFTEGTVQYDASRLKAYTTIEMPVDTLDNVLSELKIEKVDLVSITTNGSEKSILAGMKHTIQAGLPYICMARTSEDLLETLHEVGYELYAHDDRGFTFRQTSASPNAAVL